MDRIAFVHCGRDFIPNHRVKNQQYCKLPIKITRGIALNDRCYNAI
jgi:hypothetical protein